MASKHAAPSPDSGDSPARKRLRSCSDVAPAMPQPKLPLGIALNPADCDLDFDIDGNGFQGQALCERGFAYCWSGARANVGITKGKYCFGCKIVSEQKVDMPDTPPDQQHVCRIGVSRGDEPVGNLGESIHSFGYGGTGKFSSAKKFSDYGSTFGVGDTITCCVNLEDLSLGSIGFLKNGRWLGIASHFNADSVGCRDAHVHNQPWKYALFPHVLLKNVVVQLLFSEDDGLVLEEGYKPWNSAVSDGNAIDGPSLLSPDKCEVIMMVGLPASGKSTWAEKWVKEHPEKRYTILGTNLALDQMKVPGLLRKQNYGERFERLMDQATGIFNTLLQRASKTSRNYIIDQTNVYKRARIRKLKAFYGYHKIAMVIFPTPNELKLRAEKRFKEMGKEVPEQAVNEMIVNYEIPVTKNTPGSDEVFDEVIFPELSRVEAERYLYEMKQELQTCSSNHNKGMLPYSRESSIQSFSSPYPVEKLQNPVASGQIPKFQSTGFLAGPNDSSNLQVNTYSMPDSGTYQQLPGSHGNHFAPRSSAYYQMPGSSVNPRTPGAFWDYRAPGSFANHQPPGAFGHHHGPVSFREKNSAGSFLDGFSPATSYDNLKYGISPSHQAFSDTSLVPGGLRLSQTHGTSDVIGRPGFEGYSSSGSNYEYPVHPRSTPAAQIYNNLRYSHVDNLDSREPFQYELQNAGQGRQGSRNAAPLARPRYENPSDYSRNPYL